MTWFLPVPSIWLRKALGRALAGAAMLGLALLAVLAVLASGGLAGWGANRILSGSMAPAIPVGSVVITRQLPLTRYKVGDVVSFREPGSARIAITHRITGIAGGLGRPFTVRTKGDANTNGDPWVLAGGAVTGKVVATVPWIGYPLAMVGTKIGFLVFAALLFAAFVYRELRFLIALMLSHTRAYRLGG